MAAAGSGSLLKFKVRFVPGCSAAQSPVRAGCGASVRRSALRADSLAVLGLAARRETRYAPCRRCALTITPSQRPTRAAREAASPVLLSAAQARHSLPERAFASMPGLFSTRTKDRCCAAGGARWRRCVGRRGAQIRGRRAQRASSTCSRRLFERSAGTARSEFCRATPNRAPQRSRRAAPTAPVSDTAGYRLARHAERKGADVQTTSATSRQPPPSG